MKTFSFFGTILRSTEGENGIISPGGLNIGKKGQPTKR